MCVRVCALGGELTGHDIYLGGGVVGVGEEDVVGEIDVLAGSGQLVDK